MKALAVGVDLGATGIKAGLVDGRGRVLARAQIPTLGGRGPQAVLSDAASLVLSLSRGRRVCGLGVGSCGTIDAEKGTVLEATSTMRGWAGTRLASELERRTGLRCRADNDGNAAALGEAVFGAGRGAEAFAMLTLGTGIGGGLVIGGRPLRGAGFSAGKLGHLKVRPGGRLCACGGRGCVEAYASAFACRRAFPGLDAREVFSRALRGDRRARSFLEEAAQALGFAFAEIANAVNPSVIAVGGGLSRGWAQLLAPALSSFRRLALPAAAASTRIVRARLGLDAGVIGAALLVS